MATAGAGAVLAFDAVTYAFSVIALALLRLARKAGPAGARTSLLSDLSAGWSEFRKRTWMWVITLQFSVFKLGIWAPFLVLGPVVADQDLGRARAWA